jgi:hypothetical protein
LGQVAVDLNQPPAGLIVGANAPKPGRASKVYTATISSGFYDIAQIPALKAADWKIVSRPFIRRGKPTKLAQAVVINHQGIKYAWMMPKETYNSIGQGNLTALGITNTDQNDKNLVWGAAFPKLPRASFIDNTGSGGVNKTLSTFVDPTKVDDLPPGWAVTGKEYV